MGNYLKELADYIGQPKASLADTLTAFQKALRPGTSITLDSTGVTARIGQETFELHKNSYELQEDLYAFYRLSKSYTRRMR